MTTDELKSICSNISGTPFDYFQKGYETLLKELKDKGIIKEWYYNGEYHFEPYMTKDEAIDLQWELKETDIKLSEYKHAYEHTIPFAKQQKERIDELENYILDCWKEEDINDYSNYCTNTKQEHKKVIEYLRNLKDVRDGKFD